jgi:hypothetical protein
MTKRLAVKWVKNLQKTLARVEMRAQVEKAWEAEALTAAVMARTPIQDSLAKVFGSAFGASAGKVHKEEEVEAIACAKPRVRFVRRQMAS